MTQEPGHAQDKVTPDAVRMAYRLLLGREPENERVVAASLAYPSLAALRAAFMQSPEFRRKSSPNAELTPTGSPPLEVEWQVDAATGIALLAHVGATWTRLGAERPHWSVLSSARHLPDQIAANRDAFFRSGMRDRDQLLAVLARLGLSPADYPVLFEFGCGVARVTPYLADSFARVMACDVSASHLALAHERLAEAPRDNVTLRLATPQDFGMTTGFDLWFSHLVLQHNPPPVIAMVLRRALSLLNPGGIAHFQLPTYRQGYRFHAAEYLAGLTPGGGEIEMHALPQPILFDLAAQCGCEPLEIWQDSAAGPLPGSVSSVVTLRKRGQRISR